MPVRISLGRPRFIAEASEWPYVKELAPLGLLKIDDRAEFIARYHDRLSRIGLGVIRAALEKVWQHQSEGSWRATPLDERLPIALLCFEDVASPTTGVTGRSSRPGGSSRPTSCSTAQHGRRPADAVSEVDELLAE